VLKHTHACTYTYDNSWNEIASYMCWNTVVTSVGGGIGGTGDTCPHKILGCLYLQ